MSSTLVSAVCFDMGLVKAQVPTVYGSNYVPELTYTTPTHQLLIDHGPPLTTMDDGPPTHDKTSSQPQAQAARNSRAVAGEMDESLLREENCRSKEQLDSQELSTLPLPPRTYRLIKADFLYPQYSRDSMCD